jgi:hypothetical protein
METQIGRHFSLSANGEDQMVAILTQVLEETEYFCCWRQEKVDRGRTASYLTAPAQIPACGFPAPGSS